MIVFWLYLETALEKSAQQQELKAPGEQSRGLSAFSEVAMPGFAYDMDDLLTGKVAAAVAKVSPQLISYWVEHGYLKPDPRGKGKRAVYRRGDVLQAESKARASMKSSRNRARQLQAA